MPIKRLRLRPKPDRALSEQQQNEVLDLLHEPRFADQAPAEIYATLLDEGRYHCSVRTMYRLLHRNKEVRERRSQLRHLAYAKPELLAERPNEVWSWDITKLRGPAKWSYFYLYIILDIYSRRVVGWHVADAETAALFEPLFHDAVAKHNVPPGQLTLHADRGGPMKAKATALLLSDLGVIRSHMVGVSRYTVAEYLRRAAVVGITWPVPDALDDMALESKLFTSPFTSEPERPQPEWARIHAELRKPSVTLLLLWEEYRAGQPDGYGYSRFCDLHAAWRGRLSPTKVEVAVQIVQRYPAPRVLRWWGA